MSPKLRQDLQDAAAVATLVLALVAAVGWIKTWPGWVVPRALTVAGVTGCIAARIWANEGVVAIARGFSVDERHIRHERRRLLVIIPVLVLGMVFVDPWIARVFGVLTLAAAIAYSAPRVWRALARRYDPPESSAS